MCRHNQLLSCALIAFGLGILISTVITGGFVRFVIGIGSIVLGFILSRKK